METDLALGGGRTLHVYDTGTGDATAGFAVFWHHGTPNTGAPPEPLFAAAAERGIRWVSHDRPGYGGSTPAPGRDVASAAADVVSIANALGIDRFAVMGHSGGGPHALACAAVLPGRVRAAVCVSGLAPFGVSRSPIRSAVRRASAESGGDYLPWRMSPDDVIADAGYALGLIARGRAARGGRFLRGAYNAVVGVRIALPVAAPGCGEPAGQLSGMPGSGPGSWPGAASWRRAR